MTDDLERKSILNKIERKELSGIVTLIDEKAKEKIQYRTVKLNMPKDNIPRDSIKENIKPNLPYGESLIGICTKKRTAKDLEEDGIIEYHDSVSQK